MDELIAGVAALQGPAKSLDLAVARNGWRMLEAFGTVKDEKESVQTGPVVT